MRTRWYPLALQIVMLHAITTGAVSAADADWTVAIDSASGALVLHRELTDHSVIDFTCARTTPSIGFYYHLTFSGETIASPLAVLFMPGEQALELHVTVTPLANDSYDVSGSFADPVTLLGLLEKEQTIFVQEGGGATGVMLDRLPAQTFAAGCRNLLAGKDIAK